MNKTRNCFFGSIVILSVVLTILGFLLTDSNRTGPEIRLVSDQYTYLNIEPCEKDGVLYFFVPSGIETEDMHFSSDESLYINERDINTVFLNELRFGENYVLANNRIRKEMIIMGSENVPTVYVDLLRKGVEYLNSDKQHVLDSKIYILEQNGNETDRVLFGTIKGRGNHSWNLDKKAYNLNLEDETDLFSMGAARRWALVSNAMDFSSLRNKTVYEFAKMVGMEWTPEGQYVNLYLNGNYNGLYLLCERIEADKERLDLKKSEVLLKKELPERLDIINNGFLTKDQNVIEITYPDDVSSYNKETIVERVQKMEDSIVDLDSEDWKERIDIDSWARVYLIDELFDNFDSGIASAYFYIKNDGKAYRGPVWDYDAIMFDDPVSVVANSYDRQPYSTNEYYYCLYQREEFRDRLKEIYKDEFIPALAYFTKERIPEISSQIDKARSMDAARWGFEYQEEGELADYLRTKSDFLTEFWKDESKYCKIQIQKETFYLTFMTEKGSTIDMAHGIDLSLFDDNTYCYADSDILFNVSDVINEDVRLNLADPTKKEMNEPSFIARFGALNLLFLVTFVFILAILFIRNKKKYYGQDQI